MEVIRQKDSRVEKECLNRVVLSDTVSTNHMCLLNTWNVAIPDGL